MIPEALLNEATKEIMARGVRVFQGAHLAPTEADHVSALLAFMRPREGAAIVDMGCGIGEVSRLMKAERSDLNFVCVNNNAYQLSLVPEEFQRVLADMHATRLDNASVDGVMFCYSLCHSDFRRALVEAARITRKGGFLFVYDYERMSGWDSLFKARLDARALPRENMEHTALRVGWTVTDWINPYCDDTPFRSAYANDDEYDNIFRHLRVCMWKAIRV